MEQDHLTGAASRWGRVRIAQRGRAVAVGVGVLACGASDSARTPSSGDLASAGQVAVCIEDGASVRAAPASDGRESSTLALSEQVTVLDEAASDRPEGNDEFLRIRAAGGLEGWVEASALVRHARPAAIKEAVPVYRRPDSLSMTADHFDRGDVVAVVAFHAPWVRVVGSRGARAGWIAADALIWDEINVATASLLARIHDLQDSAEARTLARTIVEVEALDRSVFHDEVLSLAGTGGGS